MKLPKCKDIPAELWPPKNSREDNLDAYRLLRQKSKIDAEDFLSCYELDVKRNRVKMESVGDDSYYAISIFCDIDDAMTLKRKFPNRFLDISRGITRSSDGCVRGHPSLSGKSHAEWWLYDGATPEAYFSVIGDKVDE